MDTPASPTPPPAGTATTSPVPKKGLGTGAKVGIGCGALLLVAIIALVVFSFLFGGKIAKFAQDAQENPTRATAELMVSAGSMELVAEDDVNKRYTIKEPETGELTTIYWDAAKNAPEVIKGDFSAIPPATAEPAAIEE